jgi:hypothetical protein
MGVITTLINRVTRSGLDNAIKARRFKAAGDKKRLDLLSASEILAYMKLFVKTGCNTMRMIRPWLRRNSSLEIAFAAHFYLFKEVCFRIDEDRNFMPKTSGSCYIRSRRYYSLEF